MPAQRSRAQTAGAAMDAEHGGHEADPRHRRRPVAPHLRASRPGRLELDRDGSPIPLVGRIDVAGTRVAPKWTYRDAAVEKSDGMKVTITFANADPAMELKSVWHAHEGPGPVRHAMFIANKSGRPVTIYEQESLDVRVAGPGKDAGVWYIKNDASVPDKTGVYHEPLAPGYRKAL